MMKFLKITLAGLFCTLISMHAAQAQSMRIAAIVNEDIITVYDVQARMGFVVFTSQSKPDQAGLKRIQNEAIRALIDESLKVQEAERSNITISDAILEREVAKLEQRNKMPKGQLYKVFKQNNLDIQTLKDRIYADLAWQRYITRELRRKVRITEDQIDDELSIISSQADKTQKRVFEIFLPLETVEQEADTRASAIEIRDQIANGARFTSMARNFSKASSSQLGGDRGWLSPGQLPEELDAVVQSLKPGEISQPVETLTGIYLFQVTEERLLGGDKGKTELAFAQLAADFTAQKPQDVAIGQLQNLRGEINSCQTVETLASNDASLKYTKTNSINLEDLNATIQQQVQGLQVGETTAPIIIGNSATLITICSRKEPKSNLPSRADIRRQLLAVKLDVLARQHLRDVRNSAFIDVRR